MARKKTVCPKCGSKKVIWIIYGFPARELIDAAKRGEIALGGCIIGENQNHCNDCGHEW